ncbi:glycosyl hydrolase 53 family protein [Rhodocaloribacter litoris]|uniref:glycosyl hydrolase 53 family protein n=1 Tax=Rhodocaloribacter litoris TaxID=2558931 RepID=UPI0021D4735F|nr:glycosyl hydrolase 53 family protein [Rhodocaloribacter litoris]
MSCRILLALAFLLPALFRPLPAPAQSFHFGADLSYANMMEDCGAVFKEHGTPTDVYAIFAHRGHNLVRARLWVDPAWQEALVQPPGVKPRYNDLDDVRETFSRARAAGMQLMLGLHYSDFWADPSRQVVPARWAAIADDVDALADSVHAYTKQVLTTLDADGLMPEFVKIGNETNGGLLVHRTMNDRYEPVGTLSTDWSRHAVLFNAAIRAVREVGATAAVTPKIVLHFAGLNSLVWRYQNLVAHGVTDFDVMGFSYYYAWHEASIRELGETIRALRSRLPGYEVMVVETGYPWTRTGFDSLPNIITTPDPDYLPVIPEKQLEYLVDYAREVMRSGGIGVIFWEPAWVSTPCRTPWGQGSSQEHVAFFDPVETNFMENGGGRWPEAAFYEDLDAHKITFQVDMTGQDTERGVYIRGTFTDGEIVPMADLGEGLFSFFAYLPEGATGTYHFLNGPEATDRETVPAACAADGTDRRYTVPASDAVFAFRWADCTPLVDTPVEVTFAVDMTGQDTSRGVYITGHVTDWEIVRMTPQGEAIYTYTTSLMPGSAGAYYYLTTSTWDNYQAFRESVPAACATWYGSDRGYVVPDTPAVFAVRWGTCETFAWPTAREDAPSTGTLRLHPNYPNPFRRTTTLTYTLPQAGPVRLAVYDVLGRRVALLVDTRQAAGTYRTAFDATALPPGLYIARLTTPAGTLTRPLVRAQGHDQ